MDEVEEVQPLPCICHPDDNVSDETFLESTKECFICKKTYIFHDSCLKQWWEEIPKSKKFPLVTTTFLSKNTGLNRFYCRKCQTLNCPPCKGRHTLASDDKNAIIVICMGIDGDMAHPPHWFISNNKCYSCKKKVRIPKEEG